MGLSEPSEPQVSCESEGREKGRRLKSLYCVPILSKIGDPSNTSRETRRSFRRYKS